MTRKPANQVHFWCGAFFGGPMVAGGSTNNSSILAKAPFGRGFCACSTSSGVSTVRPQ